MNKSAIREKFKAKREQLSFEEKEKMSESIAHLFFSNFDLKPVNTIHLFKPIEESNEVNIDLIALNLMRTHKHIQIINSVTQTDSNLLRHFKIDTETKYKTNKWGIPEPIDCIDYTENKFDVVFIPLLAFDKNGHRVGYGKGYYDTFLSKINTDCLRIGVSMFDPVDEIEDYDSFDIKLTHCITPNEIHNFI